MKKVSAKLKNRRIVLVKQDDGDYYIMFKRLEDKDKDRNICTPLIFSGEVMKVLFNLYKMVNK